jgi:transposase
VLPPNAIVRRTGHDHKTVQRWARRFAAEASLLDRARTGRPVTRVTGRMVTSIRRLVKDKWRQSTRRTAAKLRARGTPISHCTLWRALKDDGNSASRYGEQRRLRFAAEQKDRLATLCVCR